MSIRAIAAVMGVSPTTVQKTLAAPPDENGMIAVGMVMGLDGKMRPSRRFDTTQRDRQIRELRGDGKSIRAIAAETACSVGTVHRVLNRLA
jgi:transposase